MVIEAQQVMEELKDIKEELEYIREHMVDKDMFLDAEEKQLLEESYEHQRQGKLVSSKELRHELGL